MEEQNISQPPIALVETQPKPKIKSSSFPKWPFIVILSAIILLSLGTYFADKILVKPFTKPTPSPITTVVSPTPIDETASWKMYKNNEYGFRLKYPDEGIGPDATRILNTYTDDGREIVLHISSGIDNLLAEKTLYIQITTNQLNNDIKESIGCNSSTSNTAINGVNFAKSDVSEKFAEKDNTTVATQYCAIKNNMIFKLTSEITVPKSNQPLIYDIVKEQRKIDQILSSFEVTKIIPSPTTTTHTAQIINSPIPSDWKTFNNISYPPSCEIQSPNGLSHITCPKDSFTITIDPGGHGIISFETIVDLIKLGDLEWTRTIWTMKEGQKPTLAVYYHEEKNVNAEFHEGHYLEVKYDNYTTEAQNQAEKIIATFKP